ncbi:hypothetical protein Xoosp13_301 [Xanthomonas phage Xoo-sp13]|nr:hypothetical protein Xoosp13_301 [Xanthomonas phage Xoo-sp13]
MDKKYIFATLALGTAYTFKVTTLIDCVLLLTKGDILIITDDVKELSGYVERNHPEKIDRVKLFAIEDVTKQNIWYAERQFNYNLKMLPTKVAYGMQDYDMIVHADADGFMIGWNEEEWQQFIDHEDKGLIARFRNRPCEEVALQFMTEPKATALSIELINIKARMPIEVFMFFKPKCKEFREFMAQWEMITRRCYDRGINPFIEALEISYAMSESKLPHHPILDYMRPYPVLHTFRYLHHDKIMRII